MTKTHKQIIMLILTATLLAGVQSAEAESVEQKPGFFRRLFSKLTWNELVTVVESPKEICIKVRQNVEYREDLSDVWENGKKTWDKGSGDCEDLAACVVDLCKEKGFEADILIFYPKGSWEAHAVAVGQWNGEYWISSNGWYQKVKSI